jgi:multidrug efflux pump subunit AcrB
MATSVAILAIFLPVVFIKGVIGKYFFQFGMTISAAVMLSLLEALTLAPHALFSIFGGRPRRDRVSNHGSFDGGADTMVPILFGALLAQPMESGGHFRFNIYRFPLFV